MANDIVGAPEPVIIGTEFFYFSPLSDFELSELDAWVSFRREKLIERLTEDWFLELATTPGTTQLLVQSVKRTKPMSVMDAASFLGTDGQLQDDVYDFWFKLNFVDVAYPEATGLSSNGKLLSEVESRERTYTALSKYYKWTFQQIAAMTPFQQYKAEIQLLDNKPLTFATEGEYAEWRGRFNNGQ